MNPANKTLALVFPFDLFGSPGTSAGAQLLGDAVQELLADTRAEERPTRSHVFRDRVRYREVAFETLEAVQSWRETAGKIIRASLKVPEFLLFLGGNHLGVLPLYEELPAGSLVIQLDAHLDVYNLSDCTEELSHGNFLLHARVPLPPIVQLGHRDLFLPHEHVQQTFQRCYGAAEIAADPLRVLDEVKKVARKASSILLDIDCDVFDPAYFPAVPHPLPFGLAPQWLLMLVNAIGVERLLGVAISEFDPGRDRADQSLATLGWFVEWLLLKRYES